MRLTDYPMLEEIRDEYHKLRISGKSREEAEKFIQQNYSRELEHGSDDDALFFWIGLGDAQHFMRELSEVTAEQALAALDKLSHPEFEVTPGDLKRRRKWYTDLMPERKKIKPPRRFRCEWKIGDTFAYRIGGTLARERGIEGKIMLIRKVHELEWSDGRSLPVVTFTLWDSNELPKTATEFASSPMLKVWGDVLNKCQSGYIYRAQLLFSREKQTEIFQFIGNFQDISMPKDEIIVHDSALTPMTNINSFDDACCIYWNFDQYYSQL